MDMPTFSFQTYTSINNVVMALHSKMYRGQNQSSRYKIGKGIIAVVEDNMLSRIIDFNKNRIIEPDRVKYIVSVSVAGKESSLAEDVIEQMTDTIKAVTTDHIIKAYEAANMLPERWLLAKLDQIYKYAGRFVNPQN